MSRKSPRRHQVHTRDPKYHVPEYGRGMGQLPPAVQQSQVPEFVKRELDLVTFASEEQFERLRIAWALNFYRKKRRGIFDRSRAIDGLANNLVPMMTRFYRKKWGDYIDDFNLSRLSREQKREIAEYVYPAIEEQVRWYESHPEDYKKDSKGY